MRLLFELSDRCISQPQRSRKDASAKAAGIMFECPDRFKTSIQNAALEAGQTPHQFGYGAKPCTIAHFAVGLTVGLYRA